MVYNMSHEDPGDVTYSGIGGLGEQIRELRYRVYQKKTSVILNMNFISFKLLAMSYEPVCPLVGWFVIFS